MNTPQNAAGRVQSLIDRLEITPYQFAKETGLSHQTISNLLTGKNKPSLDTLEAIATRYPGEASWLLTGVTVPGGRVVAVALATPASPLRINTDGESESYWKALAADLREQVKAAAEREKWLQHQFQELVGKSPASAYTAVPVSAPVPRSIGFGQMWLAPAA